MSNDNNNDHNNDHSNDRSSNYSSSDSQSNDSSGRSDHYQYGSILGTAPTTTTGAIAPTAVSPGQAISGTVTGLANGGEYFLFNTAQGQFVVEPKHQRADQLGIAAGQVLNINIGREREGNKVETWGISRQDGTPLTGLGAAPNDSSYDDLTRPWFNSAAYLAKNPDVAAAGINPTRHFLKYGAREGRSSDLFSESFYLASNADVQAAKASGVVGSGWQHFVENGALEGRRPSPIATVATTQQMATSLTQVSANILA